MVLRQIHFERRASEPVIHLKRARFGVAFLAGVVGALALTILMGLGIYMQWSPFSLEMLLGSFVTGEISKKAWFIGFAWHLLNGGIFGLIYGFIFEALHAAGALTGAVIGLAHWVVAGFMISIVQAMHPFGIEDGFIPDLFLWTTWGGATFVGSLILHVCFGLITGAICRESFQIKQPTQVTIPEQKRAA